MKPIKGLREDEYTGQHVVISGGSRGIGKSLAMIFANLGAHVTIIARNKKDLEEAQIEIEQIRRDTNTQIIRHVSLDLTKITFPDNSKSELSKDEQNNLNNILGDHKKCNILVNCCGSAIPTEFEDMSQSQFRFMMDVNYFSAVNLTRLLLPTMKLQTGQGNSRVVFVSSMCGLLSFYGYSAYSASKFALTGLAQALRMELRPYGIQVTIAFPPDTNTPGFAEENKLKPNVTSIISKSGGVRSPEEVAESIVKDMSSGKFCSTLGLENNLVLSTVNSFMPDSLWRVVADTFVAGHLKLVAYFILRSWNKVVDREASTSRPQAKS